MEIVNDIFVKCEECNNEMKIDKEDFECDTSSYERKGMGAETQYVFEMVHNCDKCQNEIEIGITGVEYPVGAYDSQSEEINGGTFIGELILEIL